MEDSRLAIKRFTCIFLSTFFLLLCSLWSAALGEAGPPQEIETQKKYTKGHLSQETWVDASGNRVMNDQGYSYYVKNLNGRFKPLSITYYDTEGNLAITKSGYAIERNTFDGYGRTLSTSYWKDEDTPVIGPQGYARLQVTYRWRYLVSVEYFDEQGDHVVADNGFAKRVITHDARNRVSREEHFGADGRLIDLPEGYAYVTYENGEKGILYHEAFYDAHGNPAINAKKGYASLTQTYAPYARLLTSEYRDERGELMTQSDGYARVEYSYQSLQNNRVASEAYFDERGSPVLIKDGYASKQYAYH